MGTYLIGGLLLVCLVFAVKGAAKHFAGEGSCCGGETVSAPKKELAGGIVGKKTVKIDGMTCVNCKNRVEHLLNGIADAAAEVNLSGNIATVKMTREVSDDEIRAALDGSGYKIVSIKAN